MASQLAKDIVAQVYGEMRVSVGVTGSQLGITPRQREALEKWLTEHLHNIVELHHGDCVGADKAAHEIADRLGIYIVVHPPLDPKKRAFCAPSHGRIEKPREYLDRNKDIVEESDLVITIPDRPPKTRSGTWSTYRYARKRERMTEVIWMSGRMERTLIDG